MTRLAVIHLWHGLFFLLSLSSIGAVRVDDDRMHEPGRPGVRARNAEKPTMPQEGEDSLDIPVEDRMVDGVPALEKRAPDFPGQTNENEELLDDGSADVDLVERMKAWTMGADGPVIKVPPRPRKIHMKTTTTTTTTIEYANRGTTRCENHGWTRKECLKIGCCYFKSGLCWSAVGDAYGTRCITKKNHTYTLNNTEDGDHGPRNHSGKGLKQQVTDGSKDPCECMDDWDYKGIHHSGCSRTPDFEKPWCYAVGGLQCPTAKDSIYLKEGEDRKFVECQLTIAEKARAEEALKEAAEKHSREEADPDEERKDAKKAKEEEEELTKTERKEREEAKKQKEEQEEKEDIDKAKAKLAKTIKKKMDAAKPKKKENSTKEEAPEEEEEEEEEKAPKTGKGRAARDEDDGDDDDEASNTNDEKDKDSGDEDDGDDDDDASNTKDEKDKDPGSGK